jgi:UDP-N-acetylmuramyl tripeptide synthase
VNLSAKEIAAAMGAEVVVEGAPGAPARARIDSGAAGPGDLFFGLRGANRDGGEFAPAAIAAGAWGVVVREELLSWGGGGDPPPHHNTQPKKSTTALEEVPGSSWSRTRWRRCRRWR